MCLEPQLWGHYTYPARPSVSYVSTTSYLPPPGRFSSPFVSPFSGPLYRLEDVAGSYYYSQPSSSPSLRLSTSFGSQVSYVTPPDLYPRFSQSFSSTSFQGSDRWSSGLYPMIPVPRAGKGTGVEAQTNQPSINECYLCLPMGDPAKFSFLFIFAEESAARYIQHLSVRLHVSASRICCSLSGPYSCGFS